MKLHRSIAVCLALMAGVTADGCFAQSDQSERAGVGWHRPAGFSGRGSGCHSAPLHFSWKNTRASDTRAGRFSEQ
jgi:hypothetical protein